MAKLPFGLGKALSKRVPWFEILLTIVIVSGTLYAALSDAYNLPNRWFIRDDAYYYFKVAQNISEGHGSTFDGIHPTNGYHPLWLLICIPIFALARFDLILPLRVLAGLIGLLQLSTSIMLYRLIRRAVSAAAGILAASFWAFNSYVLVFLYKTGVESSIAVFFLVLLLTLLNRFEETWRQRPVKPGQLAAFAGIAVLITFSRLDLIFVALIFGIWIIFRGSSIRYLLPLDMLALIVATVAAFLLRLGFPTYYDVANTAVVMLSASLIVRIPLLYALGLYRAPRTLSPMRLTLRTLMATVLGGAGMAAILSIGAGLHIFVPVSRAVFLIEAGLSFGLLTAIRLASYAPHIGTAAKTPVQTQATAAEWRRWLTEAVIYFGILGGALGAYMLWNQLGFGTFTPVSGQIKHWWGTFTHSIYGSSASNWLTFFAVNPFSEFNAWAPPTTWLSDVSNPLLYKDGTGFGNPTWRRNFSSVLLAAFVVVSLVLALGRRKAVRAAVQTSVIPLFVGSWLQILGYNVTGYASPKEWYWLTEPVVLVILAAMLVDVLIRLLFGRWRFTRALVWILVAWYGTRGAYTYLRDAYYLSPYGLHPKGTPYSDIIPFLEANTEPGAIVGMTGGGNIGYLMPSRTIVNMDGLINSNEYFQDLEAGTAADYLYNTGMRYVFANPTILDANPYRGQFSDRLHLRVNWSGKDLLRLLPAPAH